MTEEERRRYLVESLFLNCVTYENEMLDAYMRKLTGRKKGGAGARRGGRHEDAGGGALALAAGFGRGRAWPRALRRHRRLAPARGPRIVGGARSFDFGKREAGKSWSRRSS